MLKQARMYYLFMKNEDWLNSYRNRTDEFQAVIDYDMYISEMEKLVNDRDWTLYSYKFIAMKVLSSTQVELTCIFTEGPQKNQVTANVDWVYQDGHWRCHGTGLVYPPFAEPLGFIPSSTSARASTSNVRKPDSASFKKQKSSSRAHVDPISLTVVLQRNTVPVGKEVEAILCYVGTDIGGLPSLFRFGAEPPGLKLHWHKLSDASVEELPNRRNLNVAAEGQGKEAKGAGNVARVVRIPAHSLPDKPAAYEVYIEYRFSTEHRVMSVRSNPFVLHYE